MKTVTKKSKKNLNSDKAKKLNVDFDSNKINKNLRSERTISSNVQGRTIKKIPSKKIKSEAKSLKDTNVVEQNKSKSAQQLPLNIICKLAGEIEMGNAAHPQTGTFIFNWATQFEKSQSVGVPSQINLLFHEKSGKRDIMELYNCSSRSESRMGKMVFPELPESEGRLREDFLEQNWKAIGTFLEVMNPNSEDSTRYLQWICSENPENSSLNLYEIWTIIPNEPNLVLICWAPVKNSKNIFRMYDKIEMPLQPVNSDQSQSIKEISDIDNEESKNPLLVQNISEPIKLNWKNILPYVKHRFSNIIAFKRLFKSRNILS
jgi:hypothetical protein